MKIKKNELNKRIGQNLRKLRLKRKLEPIEMAKLLRTNYQNISRWEEGIVDMKVSTFIQLAHFFEVSLEELSTES